MAPVRPGDAVLLPHGAGHVMADSPADAAAVARAVPFEPQAGARRLRTVGQGPVTAELLCGKYRLDRSRAHPLLAELPQVVHLPDRPEAAPELRAAVGLLSREVDGQRPGSAIAVTGLLDLLLVYMIRARTARGGTGAWPAVLGDPVAAAALRALHADPAHPWTTERLAAAAGVSRPTLGRRFTALMGRPPMAYLTWWRLNPAAVRLRDTADPLSAVARGAGYASPYALSHAFSREFGTTPGRYRAAVRAGTESVRRPDPPPPGPAADEPSAGACGSAPLSAL